MTIRDRAVPVLCLLTLALPALCLLTLALSAFCLPALVLSAPAASAGERSGVADRHGAWRACLHRNFVVQVALSGRVIAADAALRTCRPSEAAYLSALSASPLVDADDVGRVRPALLLRARGWLLDGGSQRPL